MTLADLRDVILRPIVSEKTYDLSDQKVKRKVRPKQASKKGKEVAKSGPITWTEVELPVYTFEVHPDADRTMVRDAVEKIFDVKVEKVNVLNRAGKRKRNRGQRTFGTRKSVKRAYVTLAPGNKISLFES